MALELRDESLATYGSSDGSYTAPVGEGGGVVWLCCDNSGSWFYDRAVRMTLDVVAAPTKQSAAEPAAPAVELQ